MVLVSKYLAGRQPVFFAAAANKRSAAFSEQPKPRSNGSSNSKDVGADSRRSNISSSRGSGGSLRAAPRARDILLKPRKEVETPRTSETGFHAAMLGGARQSYPTFVPRDPSVNDGPWSASDAQLVRTAQQQAAQHQQQQQQQAEQQQQQHGRSASTSPNPSQALIQPQGLVLLGKSAQQLSALAMHLGQARFRGQQMLDSLLQGAKSTAALKGLPASFQQQLAELGVRTGRSVVHHTVTAPDGTRKLLLQLEEGRVIEAVGIPAADDRGKQRLTVCVSSQVGCPMRCTFCATGRGGFARNLQAHEIIDQVMTVSEVFGQRASNVVFMGMGEPLLNIPAVVEAATFMQEQLGISGRAITISTVGVPNAIARLAEHQLTTTLAVSIHAANQQLREQLIPSAKVYPIQALMQDCSNYFSATGRRVTFEYTLMGGVNDNPAHAGELAVLLRQHHLMSHVNLIPWNPVEDAAYKRPSRSRVMAFKQVLEEAGLPVSVRTTRGLEAAAACGQLRNQFQKAAVQEPKSLS